MTNYAVGFTKIHHYGINPKGFKHLETWQKAEGGKKMEEEGLCNSCEKDLDLELEVLVFTYHRAKRKDIDDEGQLVDKRLLAVCSPQCMIKLLDSLKEEYQKEIDKDKTNAVGPTMKGSPGCAHGS